MSSLGFCSDFVPRAWAHSVHRAAPARVTAVPPSMPMRLYRLRLTVGLRPTPFGSRNARGLNSDEGVSSTQLRLGLILVHQLLRTAFFMESNGFHGGSLADVRPY